MGYSGQIEVVYGYFIKEKMGYLIPGYDIHGPDRQRLSDHLEVTSIEEFTKSESAKVSVPFALTGAEDYVNADTAKTLNADVFLRLNPRKWTALSELLIRTPRGTFKKELTELTEMAFATLPTPQSEKRATLERDLSTPAYLAKRDLIYTLNELSQVDFLPAYNVERDDGDRKLARLTNALLHLANTEKVLTKGVVVGIFSELDIRELKSVVDEVRATHPILAEKIQILSGTDGETPAKLRRLSAGEVALVQIGFVPQRTFEIMFESATLPPICAGKSTSNFLQSIGKPFLATHTKEIVDLESTHPGYSVYQAGSLALRGELEGDVQVSYDAFRNAIEQFRNPKSPLRGFFTDLKGNILRNDKLVEGLKAAQAALKIQQCALELKGLSKL